MQPDAIPLAEAADLFPRRNGKKVHVLTLKRRVINGCHGVHLQAFKIGSMWYTTAAWVEQFQAECTRSALGDSRPRRSAANRRRANERAKEILRRRFGIDVERETERFNKLAEA